MKRAFKSACQGVSMIEVLVTILIVALGMFGVAKFQGLVLMAGSYAKERAVATQLAQEKLDDLRSYVQLASASGVFDFGDIATNTGGSITSGNVTASGVQYNRTWSVAGFYYCSAASSPSTTNCSPAKTYPDFKRITVTVAWVDADAAKQGVALDPASANYCTNYPNYCTRLESVIYPNDPSLSLRGLTSIVSRTAPYVGYTPMGVPDAVPVPMDLGSGATKETSKPLPDVSSKGYSVRTSFDVVTYSGTATNGHYQTDVREEFATVSCVCEFDNNGPAYVPARYVWDGNKLVVSYPSQMYSSKARGIAPSITGDTQDPLCEACCRDHHDVKTDTATALFDPARISTDYSGSDHKHYYFQDAANPALGLEPVTPASGAKYLESCRFVRADGDWRIFQDWRMVDVTVMPKDNYLSNNSTLALYQDYVADVVESVVKTDAGTSTALPSKGSLSARDFNIAQGAYAQLLARGIYVDKIYKANLPQDLDTTYYTALTNLITSNGTWLDKVAFYEVNVTLLGSWDTADDTRVEVTNQTIQDIAASTVNYYGTYNRGRVLGGAVAGASTVHAYVLPSNSGLTGGVKREVYPAVEDYDAALGVAATTIGYDSEIGIDRHDHRSGNRISDFITVTRTGGGGSTLNVNGIIAKGNAGANLNSVSISGTGGATCTIVPPTGDQTTYSCTVSSGWAGSITIATSQTYGFFSKNNLSPYTYATTYDFSGAPVTSTSSGKNFYVYSPAAEVRGTCTGVNCGTEINIYLTGSSPTSYCSIGAKSGNDFPVTCYVDLDASLHTWTGTISIANKSSYSNKLRADSASCGNSDTTAVKSTASITSGPADSPGAFAMCAK